MKSSVDVSGEYFRGKHRVLDSAIDMLRNAVKNMCLQEEKASFCSAGKKKKNTLGRGISFGKSRRAITYKFISIVNSATVIRVHPERGGWLAFSFKQ